MNMPFGLIRQLKYKPTFSLSKSFAYFISSLLFASSGTNHRPSLVPIYTHTHITLYQTLFLTHMHLPQHSSLLPRHPMTRSRLSKTMSPEAITSSSKSLRLSNLLLPLKYKIPPKLLERKPSRRRLTKNLNLPRFLLKDLI